MNADTPQLEAPELSDAVTTAVWEVSEGREAEYRRLLMLLFGPRAQQTEPEHG
ncbi:hypothetical protein [Streptomyces mirabilis]|uniref:hypothetical protein n=1 Tax=Streptomyces mirabilis TaxID=68239 RepID=UPI0022583BB3|nr:hypothetical protein [Streptomyces mirabilis]MCX4612109.1 hypothetical protein [Streptomyces mirabilis]